MGTSVKCSSCQYWLDGADFDSAWGECELSTNRPSETLHRAIPIIATHEGGFVSLSRYQGDGMRAVLITDPEFGCVSHERKTD